MPPLIITPNEPPPFNHPMESNRFYCNGCQKYSSKFYESAIKSKFKRCKDCHKKTLEKKKQSRSKHEQLLLKLKQKFRNINRPELARSVTMNHVASILESNGIGNNVGVVRTITPKVNEQGEWTFRIELYNTNEMTRLTQG